MKSIEQYNGLNGAYATRNEIKEIILNARKEEQNHIANKLIELLRTYPKSNEFEIDLSQEQQEILQESLLPGIDYMAIPEEGENPGMGKAVSPDEIYQMITDLMINTIKKVGHLPWQREWEKTNLYQGKQALNFVTKKPYRGINYFLLNFKVEEIDGEKILTRRNFDVPYFLTFNQIEKNNGKLKKGSKGFRVVYFTKLYQYEETLKNGEKLSFGSYNQKKFLAWIKKNQSKLQILKRKGWTVERLANSYIPILKYYNVFNADDITGINWGETPKNPNVDKTKKERIEIAESIVNNMPNAPKILYEGDQPAYYPDTDTILMTPIEAFKNEQSYYTTIFHEMVHSTGARKRLKREGVTLGGLKTKKDYAFEELIAEMGAVFLSSEAGILFKTLDNSAKYLKGWNSRLVSAMEEDNRFFFRASSKSQAAADYILDRNKEGVPAYQIELAKKPKPKPEKKEEKPKPKKKKTVKKSPSKKKEDTNKLLEKEKSQPLTAKTKKQFEKELKKFGFEIVEYNSDQQNPKEWERTYKLNYKDVAGFELKLEIKPLNKEELDGEYEWKGIGLTMGGNTFAKNIPEFYEEVLNILKDDFNFTVNEANDLKKEYADTLFSKKSKAQLALFAAREKQRALNCSAEEPKTENEPASEPVTVQQEKKNIEQINTSPEEEKLPRPAKNEIQPAKSNSTSLASRMQQNQNRDFETYKISDPEISTFLGEIEIKEKESIGISIAAPQGAGKTRFAFQLVNAFSENYKVGIASMEEHPESNLFLSKVPEYIAEANLHNVDAPEIESMQDLHKLIMANDVIVIDSFEKLREIDKNVEVDNDLRKKYDGKLFIIIFQQTSDGKMRGGSKSQFDVDIVLMTEKFDDYRENFIYTNKNRYNDIPANELKFNIYYRKMVKPEKEAGKEEKEEKPENFSLNNIVATPINE